MLMLNKFFRMTMIVIFLCVLLTPISVMCGEIHSDAGTSAFPFLKINIGARAIAMGGAATGLADDESALYYNPAGIVSFEEKRWIGGYHNYFVDMQSGFVGMIFPLNDKSSMAYAPN